MSTSDSIVFELDKATGVAVLTLNRPERLNAFNKEMVGIWCECLLRAEKDAAIKAVVVTGRGKAFCAGGDMDELESFLDMTALERKNYLWEHVHQIPLALERVDCPVIAALNGTARGAGLDMALMCDIRLIDESAVLAESYIAMGLMPGDGGSYFLPRLVGVARALELLWTGDPITAAQAERLGLVSRVTPDGEVLAQAVELAARIARNPSPAIRFTKRSVQQSFSTTLRGHLDMVSSHMSVLEDSPAFRDRVAAFKGRKKNPR